MKKMYEMPNAEIVQVRCNEKLLQGLLPNESNDSDHTDAKEMQIRFEEEQEMHEELGKIFSEDNLVNPWE